jgi:multiple sugar transport system permease protein/sn-glycerol 3-phosphate transport system permease protein
MAIVATTAHSHSQRRAMRREWLLMLLFAGPNFFFLAVFSYWPIIYNGYLSTVDWDLISPHKVFAGLSNYVDLTTDSDFARILLNTALFSFGGVVATMALGLMLAVLLNQGLRGRDAARTVLFAPVVVSGAAIAVVWAYIFDPGYGLLRVLFNALVFSAPHWLTDTTLALPAVIIVYAWKNLGYAMVIYLAGLQSIPKEILESATVDGAGPSRRFFSVSLPLLSPTTFFLLVTSVLASLQAFDIIKVLTAGGPVVATTTLIYHMYEQGFVAFHAGRAASTAILLFTLMLIATIIQVRYVERRVHY